jgi:hypothetical protein
VIPAGAEVDLPDKLKAILWTLERSFANTTEKSKCLLHADEGDSDFDMAPAEKKYDNMLQRKSEEHETRTSGAATLKALLEMAAGGKYEKKPKRKRGDVEPDSDPEVGELTQHRPVREQLVPNSRTAGKSPTLPSSGVGESRGRKCELAERTLKHLKDFKEADSRSTYFNFNEVALSTLLKSIARYIGHPQECM